MFHFFTRDKQYQRTRSIALDTFDPYDKNEWSSMEDEPWNRAKGKDYSTASTSEPFSELPTLLDRNAGAGSHSHLWQPLPLRLWALCTLLVVLALLFVACELTLRIAGWEGFYNPLNVVSVAMTHLPLAIILFVGWIWQAIDAEVRKLAPWAALSRPTRAEDSILLDYASLPYPLVTYHALRRRHWSVIVTAVGFAACSVASIVATYLFTTQLVWAEEVTTPLTLATTLDPTLTSNTNQSAMFLHSYIGQRMFSLSPPQWTSGDFVLERISSTREDIAMLEALTTGYKANLTCDTASVSYAGSLTIPKPNAGESIQSGDKAIQHQISVVSSGCTRVYNISVVDAVHTAPFVQIGRAFEHNCSSTIQPPSLFVSGTLTFDINSTSPQLSAVAVACTPSYFGLQMDVKLNRTDGTVVAQNFTSSDHEVTYLTSMDDFVQQVEAIATFTIENYLGADANGMQWKGESNLYSMTDPFYSYDVQYLTDPALDLSPWFFMMLHTGYADALDDASVLGSALEEMYPALWRSYAAQNLFKNTNGEIFGYAYTHNQRILTRTLAFRALEACLAVLMVLTILLVFVRPRPNVQFDPSTFGALAVILAGSEPAMSAFRGTSTMSHEMLASHLHGAVLLAGHRDGSVNLIVDSPSADRDAPDNTPTPEPAHIRRWRPTALSITMKSAIVLYLLVAITTLAVIYRISLSRSGWKTSRENHLWTYAAPIGAFCLGLLLTSYAFACRALFPFFRMRSACEPGTGALMGSHFYDTLTTTVLKIFTAPTLPGGVLGIGLVCLVVLRIAVAGLFQTVLGPAPSFALSLSQTNAFSTQLDALGDTAAATGAQMLLTMLPNGQNPLRLPPWTTHKEAVAALDLAPYIAATASSVAPGIDVTLPVMYTQLNTCSELKPHTDFSFDAEGLLQFSTDGCPDSMTIAYPTDNGYWGKFQFVSCAPSDNILAVFGRSSARDNNTLSDLTMIHCQQTTKISRRPVTVIIDGVNGDNATSPSLTVRDTESDIVNYGPGVISNLSTLMTYLPVGVDVNHSHAFDGVFQSIAVAHPDLDFDSLLDGVTLATYVGDVYSAYWAILFSNKMRVPAADGARFVASIDSWEDRLVVSATATYIMEALLGVILTGVLMSLWFMRGAERVLLKAPYSIAAQISLLEGSRLLEIVRQYAEQGGALSEETLRTLLEGYAAKLGWFQTESGNERYGLELTPASI